MVCRWTFIALYALLVFLAELDFVAVQIALQLADERLPPALAAYRTQELFEIAV